MSPQVLTGIWAALLVFSSLPGVPRIAGVSNHNSALQNLNSGQNYWKRCRVGSWWGPRPVSRLLILTTDPPLVAIWAPGCSGSVSAVPVLSHLFQLGLLLGLARAAVWRTTHCLCGSYRLHAHRGPKKVTVCHPPSLGACVVRAAPRGARCEGQKRGGKREEGGGKGCWTCLA